jgi:purine-binding chemotaxis protein CheW
MSVQEETDDGLLVAEFTLGLGVFGLEARLVMEVVKVGELTRVHEAPSGVIGIRNLRGRIVTVIDMATHLGLGCVTPDPENRLLIMENQSESYGFLVDAVGGTIALDEEHIETVPSSVNPALKGKLRGVWRGSDHLTAILDSQVLFQWDELPLNLTKKPI